MGNTVQRLENDIIYVQKVGNQTNESMTALFAEIKVLASQLRHEDKPVLILSDASQEGSMDLGGRQAAAKIGKDLDYDRSATFGAALFLENTRKLMIRATDLDAKVRNFATRHEAEQWLMKYKKTP
ncbi:MAG TPA: STAS/SEC14 domain-containing protein [Candidatus Saccharimonadales bacterium]|nr:STAS/SEC14 domain-containing protein [Candidatus Saccharimonadales bacterium]